MWPPQVGNDCQECIFPDLLLIRRVSEGVGEDGGWNGGKEGFVD